MRIINEFDVSGTIHQFCMYGLFGVRTWCKWALESDSPWLMWTRIPYSARIGLSARQYVGEAARKPILQPRTEANGKKRKKRTERYRIPNFHRFRKSLATSTSILDILWCNADRLGRGGTISSAPNPDSWILKFMSLVTLCNGRRDIRLVPSGISYWGGVSHWPPTCHHPRDWVDGIKADFKSQS